MAKKSKRGQLEKPTEKKSVKDGKADGGSKGFRKNSSKRSKSGGGSAKSAGSVSLAGSGKPASGKSREGIKTQHVDFLTYKVDQLRKFYTEMLGLPSEIQDVDGLNYLVVHTSQSSTLGFMPPHPTMTGEQPGPKEPTMYFVVKDLDGTYNKLLSQGVPFMGEPEEMPWGHRVVTTTDPEGRTIMLASPTKSKK